MDMVGLKNSVAGKLAPGDMVCFEDWRNDLQVVDVTLEKNKVKALVKNFEGDPFQKEYQKDDKIVILKR